MQTCILNTVALNKIICQMRVCQMCVRVTRRMPAAGSRWHFRRVPGHLMMIGYWVSCGSVETHLLYCRMKSEGSLYPVRSCSECEKQREYTWILMAAVHMWRSITVLM